MCAPLQVVSVKAEKTVIVAVEQLVKHRIYGKRSRQTHRIFAHDEEGVAGLGDMIRIASCAPISKNKRFNVDTIVAKYGVSTAPAAAEAAAL